MSELDDVANALEDASNELEAAGDVITETADGFNLGELGDIGKPLDIAGSPTSVSATDVQGILDASKTSTFKPDLADMNSETPASNPPDAATDVNAEPDTVDDAQDPDSPTDEEDSSGNKKTLKDSLTEKLPAKAQWSTSTYFGIAFATIGAASFITKSCTNNSTVDITTITHTSTSVTFEWTDVTCNSPLCDSNEFKPTINTICTIDSGITFTTSVTDATFIITSVDLTLKKITASVQGGYVLSDAVAGGIVHFQTTFAQQFKNNTNDAIKAVGNGLKSVANDLGINLKWLWIILGIVAAIVVVVVLLNVLK